MTEAAPTFAIELEQQEGFEFKVRFDWPEADELLLDEPPPLGGAHGPNAVRLVAAAVANCLSASLVFCLRTKFRQDPGPVRAKAVTRMVRNEHGRMRIGGIDVEITLAAKDAEIAHLDRCLAQFEDFCVVTQSIRQGVPVTVNVAHG